MAQLVVMPKLGNTVESCVIVAWKVEEGAQVSAGTALCEIETDKSTMEVPAGFDGVLLKRLKAAGDDVPVLEPIAVIGAAGESYVAAPAAAASQPAPQAAPAAPASRESPAPAASPQAAAAPLPQAAVPASPAPGAAEGAARPASPRARTLAADKGFPLSALSSGSGPGGRIIERDVQAALAAGPGATVSARDLDALAALYETGKRPAGTGLGGRISAADLAAAAGSAPQAAAPKGAPASTAAAQAAGEAFPGPYADTPLKGVRKLISERMLHSLQASAQLTFNASAPAGRLMALRSRFKASAPELGLQGITVGDLVAYAAVKVLAGFPKLNAHMIESSLRTFEKVHLGLAVDTPRGLLVPTLRNACGLSLKEFSTQSKKLAADSLSGSVNPDLLSGATFTVTNLGAFGIESFTPILNEPQTGILGVDAVTPRPTIGPDGTLGAEMRIGFSLTVDHRVVDGADAARYLKALADYIADIDLALLG